MKIAVLGAGSWGSALSRLCALKEYEVCVWSIDEREVSMLNEFHEHKEKLPGVKLPESIKYTVDLLETVKDANIIILAVPSMYIRSTSQKIKNLINKDCVILNVAKGLEEDTLLTMTDIIEEEIPGAKVAVLTGPSHAEEVGKDIPTAVTVSAHDKETALFIRNSFASNTFRLYDTPDMLGVELGGAIKNVIALAAGIADGLGCGDNTKAAIITRGIAEMKRLGAAMGANPETFSGLSGIGDLIVTCGSMHSRNRKAGILIGQGKTMEEAMKEVNMVVEGVYSAKAAKQLSDKYNISMPIIEEMYKLLFENKTAVDSMNDLMSRHSRAENALVKWS